MQFSKSNHLWFTNSGIENYSNFYSYLHYFGRLDNRKVYDYIVIYAYVC